jgi:hypothetical protein
MLIRSKMSYANNFYIINCLDMSSMALMSLPDSISESIGARWQDTDIPGRTASYFGYEGTEVPNFSFSIKIHDDYCPKGIKATTDWYKALVYPEYSSVIKAPSCKVVLGNMFTFYAVCESVNVNWQPPIRDGAFIVADVDFSFKRVFVVAPSYKDVKDGRLANNV